MAVFTIYLLKCLLIGLMVSSSRNLVYGQDVTFTIPEQERIGTKLGDIVGPSRLGEKYTAEILSLMTFSILSDSGNNDHASYFSINATSGILHVKKVIDRELLCLYQDECVLTLSVAARTVKPPQYFESITVNVHIVDINDNWPQFPRPIADLTIAEDTEINKSFTLPEATDIDSGMNSIQSYTLNPETTKFRISTVSNADGSMGIKLVVVEKLDREVKDNYKLNLWASDAGTPVYSSTIILNITIDDSNDNIATFEQNEYVADVMEDLKAPSMVIKVKATDPDLAEAGQVVYSFTTKTEALYGDTFEINPESGEITLLRALDYETKTEYMLTVSARDTATNSQASQVTVSIYVHDINDFPPQITVNTLTSNGQAQVIENAVEETFVAHISVVDKDSRLNGKVQCTLDNNKFSLQKIANTTQYKMVTAYILDRETEAFTDVIITCYDHGSPSLNTSKTIPVSILDENDNAPEFEEQQSSLLIQENNPRQVYITTVKATDKDYGINSRISYSLVTTGDSNKFSIDSNSGIIKAVESLDYELQHEIELQVLAKDSGDVVLSATTSILIELIDRNDNAPKFVQPGSQFNFIIVENKNTGTQIGQILAYDSDSPPFDVIEYTFEDPTLQQLFNLDPRTGILRSNIIFDRESKSHYQLSVRAYNPDSLSLSSVASVNVYIEDDNDWSPLINFPNAENHTLPILQTTQAGDIITQITAQDRDDGNNAWLNYYITHGNEDGYFVIGISSGFITVTKDISQSHKNYFNLTIEVTDNGAPPRVSSDWLLISLNATVPIEEGFSINMAILVSLVSITGIVMILLLIAILWLLYKSKYRMHAHARYIDPSEDPTVKKLPPVQIIDRLDTSQLNVDLNSSFKESVPEFPKPANRPGCNSHNSADSGFDEVTISPHGKLVSFRAAGPDVHIYRRSEPDTQHDTDSSSGHSEDGSNTDSGCVVSEPGADDSYRDHVITNKLPVLDMSTHHSKLPPHPGYIIMKNSKSPPVIVFPTRHTNSPSQFIELDNKIMYSNKLDTPIKQSPYVPDLKSKDRLKTPSFSQSNWPDLCKSSHYKPQNIDVISEHHQPHMSSFTDSNSLMRYKMNPDIQKCASEATDNTSTTSGSYVVQGEELMNASAC